MRGKRLSLDKQNNLRVCLQRGDLMQDIARQMHVSLSTVHRYNKKLVEAGVIVPNRKSGGSKRKFTDAFGGS